MIERVHKSIFDKLSIMSDGDFTNWMQNLQVVLWIDRSTMRVLISLTLYYISCGNEPVLFIELGILIWSILPWNNIHITSNLFTMRIC